MRKNCILALALSLATGLAAPAFAATLDVSQAAPSVFGSNGFAEVRIKENTLLPNSKKVVAGGYALQGMLNGASTSSFTAWSADITRSLKLASTYSTDDTPFSAFAFTVSTMTTIKNLFDTAYASLDLTNSADSAGFQLALWEVIYEKGTDLSLKTGNFKAWNSRDAILKGQALLAGLNVTGTSDYDVTYLESTDTRWNRYSQNLLTASPAMAPSPVPLPAGAVLLLSGLAGLTVLRRRTKAA